MLKNTCFPQIRLGMVIFKEKHCSKYKWLVKKLNLILISFNIMQIYSNIVIFIPSLADKTTYMIMI